MCIEVCYVGIEIIFLENTCPLNLFNHQLIRFFILCNRWIVIFICQIIFWISYLIFFQAFYMLLQIFIFYLFQSCHNFFFLFFFICKNIPWGNQFSTSILSPNTVRALEGSEVHWIRWNSRGMSLIFLFFMILFILSNVYFFYYYYHYYYYYYYFYLFFTVL